MMKAAVLIKYGSPEEAFDIREINKPLPKKGEIQIKVEAFGLNFADVIARKGLYKPAPKPPGIIGYDAIGYVSALGEDVTHVKEGDKVVGLTRFGAYAEYVCTNAQAVTIVPEEADTGKMLALATQGCTAYYCARELVNLFPGDHVLIHAAAGGVGSLIVQLAAQSQCKIFGTASSPEKLTYMQRLGVHYPINYREVDFSTYIRDVLGEHKRLDVIFDSVGGKTFKEGWNLLGAGGRILTYGAARVSSQNNLVSRLWELWQFGFYHPIQLLGHNKAILGINILQLSDFKPNIILRVLQNTMKLGYEGQLVPHIGGIFPVEKLSEAHSLLENRKTMGKIMIKW